MWSNILRTNDRHPRGRTAILSIVAFLLAVLVGCGAVQVGHEMSELERMRRLDGPLPTIHVKGPDGRPALLGEFLGDSVTVVNAWAEWCIPCLSEIPVLVELDRTWRERGVQVLGLTVASRDSSRLASVIRGTGIQYPVLEGSGFAWAWEKLRIRSIPNTVFIDQAGIVRRIYFGAMSEKALRDVVEEVLEESRATS